MKILHFDRLTAFNNEALPYKLKMNNSTYDNNNHKLIIIIMVIGNNELPDTAKNMPFA